MKGMLAIGFVALLGLTAKAGPGAPETPLGARARPGVPVLLTSAMPTTVDLAGWQWRVDGPTLVYPPQLPCDGRAGSDSGSIALRAVPDGAILVGLAGQGRFEPADGVLTQRIRLVPGTPWQALDLFDRIVWTGPDAPTPDERALLLTWIRMGGDVVVAPTLWPDPERDLGLGSLQRVHAPYVTSPARPLPVPRLGNVLPEVYDLVPARGDGSPPLHQARLVFFAMALVLLAELVGGAGGWVGRRHLLGVSLAVAVVGGALGLWLTRRAYRPVAEASVEVVYRPDGDSRFARVRTFRMLRGLGFDAHARAAEGAPFFYRGASEPWWRGADQSMLVDEGVWRGFASDEAAEDGTDVSDNQPTDAKLREVRRLLLRVAPPDGPSRWKSRWTWGADRFFPLGSGGAPVVRVECVPVR
jgi:hypothetical protein